LDATAPPTDDDGWPRLLAAARDPRAGLPPAAVAPGLLELYGPLLAASCERLLIIGHLGQSLDGFIATESGDSRFVTGRDNILHLHRMRALCDAVIVGAGTVAADDPRLTTREVIGPNPLRVVLDPRRRLGARLRVFADGAAPTLLVHGPGVAVPPPAGIATLELPLERAGGGLDLVALAKALQARGCRRVFVEGGARTVSSFLQAGLLARLQLAVAPLLIGSGRPSVRLPGTSSLADCLRTRHRVFRMGGDVLFELDLDRGGRRGGGTPSSGPPGLERVI
jgi:diaminohydroxyphosphoribosylaminopyrimidine deaminase/5-amino-6-(5-phosphoribosylamino)uracil reductase